MIEFYFSFCFGYHKIFISSILQILTFSWTLFFLFFLFTIFIQNNTGITYSGTSAGIFSNPNSDGQNRNSVSNDASATAQMSGGNKSANRGDNYWFGSGTDKSYAAFSGDPCVLVAGTFLNYCFNYTVKYL